MDRKSFFKILPGLLAAPAIAKELVKLPVKTMQPTLHQLYRGLFEPPHRDHRYILYTGVRGYEMFQQALKDDWVMHQKALNEASEN